MLRFTLLLRVCVWLFRSLHSERCSSVVCLSVCMNVFIVSMPAHTQHININIIVTASKCASLTHSLTHSAHTTNHNTVWYPAFWCIRTRSHIWTIIIIRVLRSVDIQPAVCFSTHTSNTHKHTGFLLAVCDTLSERDTKCALNSFSACDCYVHSFRTGQPETMKQSNLSTFQPATGTNQFELLYFSSNFFFGDFYFHVILEFKNYESFKVWPSSFFCCFSTIVTHSAGHTYHSVSFPLCFYWTFFVQKIFEVS